MKITKLILSTIISCIVYTASAQATFTVVSGKQILGLSANGIYAAGYGGTGGFKYHVPTNTLTNIGGVEAWGVTDSGVVAGTYADPTILVGGSPCEISGLNVNGIWQTPGVIPGITPTNATQYSYAYDVAEDGQTFCGMVWINAGHTKAFRYDPLTGYTILKDLNMSARANFISGNGLVCGGWIQTNQRSPIIWTPDSNQLGAAGEVFGISYDGSKILGAEYPDAFVYDTTTSTYQTYPVGAGMNNIYITSISDSGTLVGYQTSGTSFPWTNTAFIKFPGQPFMNLQTYLTGLGLNLGGLTIQVPMGISRNGKILAGYDRINFALTSWIVNLDTTTTTSVDVINEQSEFTIAPNPASNELTVNCKQLATGDEIILSDMLGKIFYQSKITKQMSNIKLQTSNFPQGIYFVQLLCDNKIITKKISIVH